MSGCGTDQEPGPPSALPTTRIRLVFLAGVRGVPVGTQLRDTRLRFDKDKRASAVFHPSILGIFSEYSKELTYGRRRKTTFPPGERSSSGIN